MARNCIVLLNSSNLAGSLNHSIKKIDGSYEKLRVDYNELLQYLIGDRACLGAYVISQRDTCSEYQQTPDQLKANQRFIQRLTNFGWTPVKVEYNSQSGNMNSVIDAIWQNATSNLITDIGEWSINPSLTDVVVVNGSSSWFDVINAFSESEFQVEVAYPKIATSKLLTTNFAFLDITQFLVQSNAKVIGKSSTKG